MSKRKLPPVRGVPFPAARCRGCGKRLRTLAENIEAREYPEPTDLTKFRTVTVGRRFVRWDAYEGFHSLTCALSFAIMAYEAGYRRPE